MTGVQTCALPISSRTEGVRDGRWAVIDYGDVIVHIFNDETRLFYHLERLWKDGGNLEKYDEKAETLVLATAEEN